MPKSRNRKKKYNPNKISVNTNNRSSYLSNGPIILGEYVFPIYGMKSIEGNLKPYEIHGTCFYIGNGFFLTAKHVVDYASQSEDKKIGYFSQVTNGCVNFSSYEVIEEFSNTDIALIQSSDILQYDKKPKAFIWGSKELLIFDNVRAMGYPHGYDSFEGFSIGRGFTGTVLCRTPFKRNEFDTNCYELSFQATRGLSGGVLLDQNYRIHGLIIGNNQKSLNVFHDEVTLKDETGKYKMIEERNETTFIGLAVSKEFIFELYSTSLGKTFHQYLTESQLH